MHGSMQSQISIEHIYVKVTKTFRFLRNCPEFCPSFRKGYVERKTYIILLQREHSGLDEPGGSIAIILFTWHINAEINLEARSAS